MYNLLDMMLSVAPDMDLEVSKHRKCYSVFKHRSEDSTHDVVLHVWHDNARNPTSLSELINLTDGGVTLSELVQVTKQVKGAEVSIRVTQV